MNSIASPKKTDRAPLSEAFTRAGIATAIAAILMTIAIVSFRPFTPSEEDLGKGGDIVNQLGYGSLGALSIFALAAFANTRVVTALFSPSFLILLAFFGLSVLDAADPSSAMRAASFTLIGILTMATVLAVPRDADAFSTVIVVAGAAVIGLSYVGLVLFPDIAIHSADSIESEHAGLWRGLFSHKNIAGPVMACFSFCGIYLYRRGWKLAGALLFAAAMVFVANTGSKTTAGLVPLSILIVVLPGMIGMRLGTPLLFALAMIGTGLATLGIVFIEPIRHFAAEHFPDLTYTGRVTLWEFAGEMLAKRPWTGYGYESFWGTDFLLSTDLSFDAAWDVRPMVHGHNGYLDIAVIMGIPALCAAIWAFMVTPLVDYMRIPLRKENIYLGDLFMMILLFTALNAFLESFFFRRADPVWLFFVFSIIGLRLAARFPVKSRQAA